MPTIGETILHVSRQLNDQDPSIPGGLGAFVRWTQADLLAYYNDAIARICALHPHLVTKTAVWFAQIGLTTQVLPINNIKEIINITGYYPTGGNHIIPLTRVDTQQIMSFYKNPITSIRAIPRMYNWAYDARDPRTYYLHPAPQLGYQIVGVIREDAPQETNTSLSVPFTPKYYGPILSWMQARAYEVDQESETSKKLMDFHTQQFYTAMNAILKADKQYHNEELLPRGDIK